MQAHPGTGPATKAPWPSEVTIELFENQFAVAVIFS